jgi:phospholipid/cholesterol/gamma-HCH transport system substrate-binding protein
MSATSRAFRLGAFVLATLLILAAGVFWIGSKRLLFASSYTLYADFDNVAGLSNGAEVHVGGFTQGAVKQIDLPHRSDQKIHVIHDSEESDTRRAQRRLCCHDQS